MLSMAAKRYQDKIDEIVNKLTDKVVYNELRQQLIASLKSLAKSRDAAEKANK